MHGTLRPPAPKTYSGQWPRQTASKSKGDSRSIARNEPTRAPLSTALSTGGDVVPIVSRRASGSRSDSNRADYDLVSVMPLAMPASDVWRLLAEWAEQTPGAPAFLHGERTTSFAEMHERSLRAAQGLADLGVGPGDRVALWLPNVPAYPILYFACARLGAIAVAVNTRFRAVEVADIVGRSGAKLLACAPGFRRIHFLSIVAEVAPAALDRLAAIVVVGEEPTTPPPAIERLRRVPFDRVLSRPRRGANHAAP